MPHKPGRSSSFVATRRLIFCETADVHMNARTQGCPVELRTVAAISVIHRSVVFMFQLIGMSLTCQNLRRTLFSFYELHLLCLTYPVILLSQEPALITGVGANVNTTTEVTEASSTA